jgi:hypothetical protein
MGRKTTLHNRARKYGDDDAGDHDKQSDGAKQRGATTKKKKRKTTTKHNQRTKAVCVLCDDDLAGFFPPLSRVVLFCWVCFFCCR